MWIKINNWLYSGRQQGQVGFGDELLVSSAVSSQNSVSIRLGTTNSYDLITIPRKLSWKINWITIVIKLWILLTYCNFQ